jgi:hypothetical protein
MLKIDNGRVNGGCAGGCGQISEKSEQQHIVVLWTAARVSIIVCQGIIHENPRDTP